MPTLSFPPSFLSLSLSLSSSLLSFSLLSISPSLSSPSHLLSSRNITLFFHQGYFVVSLDSIDFFDSVRALLNKHELPVAISPRKAHSPPVLTRFFSSLRRVLQFFLCVNTCIIAFDRQSSTKNESHGTRRGKKKSTIRSQSHHFYPIVTRLHLNPSLTHQPRLLALFSVILFHPEL